MKKFVKQANSYMFYEPADAVALPPGTFTALVNQKVGIYLDKVDDMLVPDRIYGANHAERILKAYDHRCTLGLSTGVWLTGEKGSGKTMLAGVLSKELRKRGMPTVLVQQPLRGPDFFQALEHIGKACVIFDEFEKVYGGDAKSAQDDMLSVFAGAVMATSLYIITTNDMYAVSQMMKNRPSRMRYLIEYKGVPEDVVSDYLEHNLNDKSAAADIAKLLGQVPNCNFDILQTVVDEHNIFGGDVKELLGIMNVRRDDESTQVQCTVDLLVKRNDQQQKARRTFNLSNYIDILSFARGLCDSDGDPCSPRDTNMLYVSLSGVGGFHIYFKTDPAAVFGADGSVALPVDTEETKENSGIEVVGTMVMKPKYTGFNRWRQAF